MKNILASLLLVFTFSIANAQEKEPLFEKQGDLVKATYFYENGAIKEVGFFKKDKLHKEWVTYNESGEKTTIAQYDMGKKVGKWYMIKNDTVKELTYENNKLIKVENANQSDLSFI